MYWGQRWSWCKILVLDGKRSSRSSRNWKKMMISGYSTGFKQKTLFPLEAFGVFAYKRVYQLTALSFTWGMWRWNKALPCYSNASSHSPHVGPFERLFLQNAFFRRFCVRPEIMILVWLFDFWTCAVERKTNKISRLYCWLMTFETHSLLPFRSSCFWKYFREIMFPGRQLNFLFSRLKDLYPLLSCFALWFSQLIHCSIAPSSSAKTLFVFNQLRGAWCRE